MLRILTLRIDSASHPPNTLAEDVRSDCQEKTFRKNVEPPPRPQTTISISRRRRPRHPSDSLRRSWCEGSACLPNPKCSKPGPPIALATSCPCCRALEQSQNKSSGVRLARLSVEEVPTITLLSRHGVIPTFRLSPTITTFNWRQTPFFKGTGPSFMTENSCLHQ